MNVNYDTVQDTLWWEEKGAWQRWQDSVLNLTRSALNDACREVGVYCRGIPRRNERLYWLDEPSTQCPNATNVRPRAAVRDWWRVVVPPWVETGFIGDDWGKYHPRGRSATTCRIGLPYVVPNYDKLVWWGTVEWWNVTERWGRVVIVGAGCLYYKNGGFEFIAENQTTKDGASNLGIGKFTPEEWNLHGLPDGNISKPRCPHHVIRQMNVGFATLNGAPLHYSEAVKRAGKELPHKLHPQLRAEDISECRLIDWDRPVSLRCLPICGEIVHNDHRFEMRNVRLLQVRPDPETGTVPLEYIAGDLYLQCPNLRPSQQGKLEQKVDDESQYEFVSNVSKFELPR